VRPLKRQKLADNRAVKILFFNKLALPPPHPEPFVPYKVGVALGNMLGG